VGDPVKKRNALEEFLNLDPDAGVIDQARGVLNQHPAIKAQEGMTSLGTAASKALGTVGAGMDDLFGTSGDAASPDIFPRAQKIAPLSPGPLPPDALSPSPEHRGPFEAMGENSADLGAYLAGNALPFANPVGAGAVAAFPSPAQSLKRMEEEAMIRDTLEAGAVKRKEYPRVSPYQREGFRTDDVELPSYAPDRVPEIGRLKRAYDDEVNNLTSTGAYENFRDAMRADTAAMHAAEDANHQLAGGNRAMMNIGPHDSAWDQIRRESQSAPASSEAKIPRNRNLPGQSALEQYLSGLHGPRGK